MERGAHGRRYALVTHRVDPPQQGTDPHRGDAAPADAGVDALVSSCHMYSINLALHLGYIVLLSARRCAPRRGRASRSTVLSIALLYLLILLIVLIGVEKYNGYVGFGGRPHLPESGVILRIRFCVSRTAIRTAELVACA